MDADGWDDELSGMGTSSAREPERLSANASSSRLQPAASGSLAARRPGAGTSEEGGTVRPAGGPVGGTVKPTKLGIKPKLGAQKLGAQKAGSNKDLLDLGADW